MIMGNNKNIYGRHIFRAVDITAFKRPGAEGKRRGRPREYRIHKKLHSFNLQKVRGMPKLDQSVFRRAQIHEVSLHTGKRPGGAFSGRSAKQHFLKYLPIASVGGKCGSGHQIMELSLVEMRTPLKAFPIGASRTFSELGVLKKQ